MKRLLALAAALIFLPGCVSVRRYNSAIAVAYYTGVVRGMTETSRIYHLGMSRAEVNQTVDDDMDALAAEAAMETNRMVGPPPELKKTELPSRGRKDAR